MTLPMTACEWRVGEFDPHRSHEEIRIVERGQRDGTILYAVTQRGWTANHDREWEREPIPSSRDDEYIARCRFTEWEEAARVAQHLATYGGPRRA